MKYIIILLSLLSISIAEPTIQNNCSKIELLDIVFKKGKSYNGTEELRLQYGLKSISRETIKKVNIKVYLLDTKEKRVYESTYFEKNIKPNYEIPFDKTKYYRISPIPSSYGEKANIVFSCNEKNKEDKTTKYVQIKIKRKIFDSLKTTTKTKSDFETKLSIAVALELISQHGGLGKVFENFK